MAFYANQMIQFSKENINIMVEIKEESTPEETENLNVFLKVQPFIKPGSIVYTTKEEAAEEMKTELGDFSKKHWQSSKIN
jgi:cell division protein FtsX